MVVLKAGSWTKAAMRQHLDEAGFASQKLPTASEDVLIMNPLPWDSYRISKERVLQGPGHKWYYVVRILEVKL